MIHLLPTHAPLGLASFDLATLRGLFPTSTGLGGAVLAWLTSAIVFGSAAALVAWLVVRYPLRRARPAVHVAFWLVVIVKFVAPVGPGWSWSLSTLVQRVYPAKPAVSARPPAKPQWEYVFVPVASLSQPAELQADPRPAAPASAPPAAAAFPWRSFLAIGYASGVLLVACVRLFQYRRFARYCRGLPPAEPLVIGLVEGVCRQLHIRRVPCVRLSAAAPAPFIFGLWRPTLVLSPRQLGDAAETEAVILHELAHLRRGDLWIRCLQWLAGTLLFFWPVVAWVNRRIDLARESACDEWALRHGSLSPARYARCLLSAATPRRSRWLTFRPAAMAASPAFIERRIEMILSTSGAGSRRSFPWLAGGALLGWSAFVLGGASAAALPAKPAADQQASALVSQNVQYKIMLAQDDEDDGFSPFLFDEPLPDDFVIPAPGFVGPPAAGQVFFMTKSQVIAGDSPDEGLNMAFFAFQDGEEAENFASCHPGADANHDGEVGQAERDAWMIARALVNSAALLDRYPNADSNGDGALSADEAADLLFAPPMPPPDIQIDGAGAAGAGGFGVLRHQVVITQIDTDQVSTNEADTEEPQQGMGGHMAALHRLLARHLGISGHEDATAQTADDSTGDCPDGPMRIVARIDGNEPAGGLMSLKLRLEEPAPVWLRLNAEVEPSAADTAKYLRLAEEKPLETFLKMNPQADRNHDGRLTPEERDAFIKSQTSRLRERILEKHPEADTNGDGMLTPNEMHAYFRDQHLKLPKKVRKEIRTDGTGSRVIMMRKDATDDQPGAVELKIELSGSDASTATSDAPK